jgi:MOSC domain-containing protein YiiM
MIERYPAELDLPFRGRVIAIAVRPKRGVPGREVEEWDLASSADHARSQKRAVTLIQAEQLQLAAQMLGRPMPHLDTRRNLLVSGIPLAALDGRRFRVGTAVLEGTGPCDPCEHMDAAFGPGGRAVLTGMGGLTARIIETGILRRGDEILPEGPCARP